jgi:hypothetical protein
VAREPVFDAIATLEQIVIRVDAVRPLSAITWSCVAHTRNDEWTGSTVRFGLAARGPRACELIHGR